MSDFRSDTVTRPTAAMKQAMIDAPLGDDVFGDDPSVNRLQQSAAEMLGFEAALFAPSGTQTNLIALMTHCQRGEEAIVGQQWHTYRWEAGGMAVLGSVQPQPLEHQSDGSLALADIEAAIKPDDPHFAKTRLVVMENTTGGKVLPAAYMQSVSALAKARGLRCHIDGARLFNAAVALAQQDGGDPVACARDICAGYDSVSVCLSKGLGAPVGSLLLGSKDFIQQARRMRKMLGGGMRQAGVLAAAGLHALQHHVHRLAEDHANAAALSAGLAKTVASHPKLEGKAVAHAAQTNIVFFDVDAGIADAFLQHLAARGIKVTSSAQRAQDRAIRRIRWVTHLDVDAADVARAIEAVAAF
ncbi:MAG TPA: low-specificity L-threonine aldolase [Noviherbaspirillum sp.]|uniref:low-specificity L-threonine aldolase n=1 Tax=Noviherbaspirillum sp. TaxID=1926288 RepID=UPI002D57EA27|nr:low-specificity L-threonine aldolase [Noviherbaspirillum sp.]HYD96988.1 low-specificity L-threonine aldolase [Noviherbaspirillum sp.]